MSTPPCLYDTVIQSYVQYKILMQFTIVGKPYVFHGPSLDHSMSVGQVWAPPAPQGYNFYPIVWYVLTEPASLVNHTFL